MKKLSYLMMIACMLILMTACGSSASSGENSAAVIEENPLIAAENEFNGAVEQLYAAQNDLLAILSDAELVLESISKTDIADPALLEVLCTVTENGRAEAEISVPSMTSTAEEIQTQTREILEQANALQNLASEINNAVAAVEDSQQQLTDAKRMEGVTAKEACIGTVSTSTGYRAEYVVSVTHWIRASDTESLQLAWKGVGGTDGVPSISQFHSSTNDGYTETNAAVAFGSISFRNVTEGFDITQDNPVSFSVIVGVDNLMDICAKTNGYGPAIYIKYDNPKTFTFLRDLTKIAPLMTSNSWGPAPFMVVCPNAYTPNDPNGISELENFTLIFQGGSTDVMITTAD